MREELFEIKYEKYAQMLFNIAYSYTRNKTISEDIVQDTFMKYLDNTSKFSDQDDYEKYWLIRVCINMSIDQLKRNNKIILNNEILHQKEDISCENKYHQIHTLVLLLPEKYKRVIILFYFNRLSIDEISKILNISPSAVKMRLKRAKEMMKNKENKNV